MSRKTLKAAVALYFLLVFLLLVEISSRSGQLGEFLANMLFMAVGFIVGRYAFGVMKS